MAIRNSNTTRHRIQFRIPRGWGFYKYELKITSLSGVGTSVRVTRSPFYGSSLGRKSVYLSSTVGPILGIPLKHGRIRFRIEIIVYKKRRRNRN